MNKICVVITFFMVFIFAFSLTSKGDNKIKVYFNTPVNNTVSTGVNAVYLPYGHMSDTIAAYILRAKYTVDIAQYDYTYGTHVSNIAAAVDTAFAHGVTVRCIFDSGQSNTGLAYLNPLIPTLGRPSGGSGIMHDKFVIIDANSPNPDDAIVCTGSEDWSNNMVWDDYNNILFIQDSALANAYTNEFNMMWGSTTDTPNAITAKFGATKTDLGQHHFTIGGLAVDLYFSPSDHVNNQIINAINTADTDLYFAMYCLTETANAHAIVNRKNNGVYALGIIDQYTQYQSAAVYDTLRNELSVSGLKEYSSSYYIYHNKFLIVDPSNTCSDPLVLTGSHNWTHSADEYNDENTLIIHDSTIANIYYQSFYANFIALGGAPIAQDGCSCIIAPTSSFSYTTSGNNYIFTYTGSTFIDSLKWYFGDGDSSTAMNPTHVYDTSGQYTICVTVYSKCGSTSHCNTFAVSEGVENITMPQNVLIYPNPTENGNISIQYYISEKEVTTIDVYNIFGQKVATIFQNLQLPGNYSLKYHFDCPGMYFIRCISGRNSFIQKIITK